MTDIDLDPVAPIAEPPPRRFTGIVPWMVSGGMHATALLILATIVTIVREDPAQDTPPVHVTILPDVPDRPKDRDKKPITLVPPKIDLNLDTKSETEAPVNPTVAE